jgi:hypothetical protein
MAAWAFWAYCLTGKQMSMLWIETDSQLWTMPQGRDLKLALNCFVVLALGLIDEWTNIPNPLLHFCPVPFQGHSIPRVSSKSPSIQI